MKQRKLEIFLGLLVLFLMTGCAMKPGKNKMEKTSRESTSLSFSWWGNDVRHKYTLDGMQLFEKKHPYITVDSKYGLFTGYEKKLNVMVKSNTESDVMQINYSWLTTYSPDGKGFYDLNTCADQLDLSGFSEMDLSYGTVNGKLNALPIALNAPTIYFNESLLQKYGLSVPETFDDICSMAEVLKKDNIYVLGMVQKQTVFYLLSYYEQTSGEDFSEIIKDEKKMKQALKAVLSYYKHLVDHHVLMPITEFEETSYSQEKCAGTMSWITDIKNYKENLEKKGKKTVVAPYPTIKGKQIKWYVKPASMYVISKNTAHPKEAALLLDFLLNDPDMIKLQGVEKGIPVNRRAKEQLAKEGYDETIKQANALMTKEQEHLQLIDPIMENDTLVDLLYDSFVRYSYKKDSLEKITDDLLKHSKKLTSKLGNE